MSGFSGVAGPVVWSKPRDTWATAAVGIANLCQFLKILHHIILEYTPRPCLHEILLLAYHNIPKGLL